MKEPFEALQGSEYLPFAVTLPGTGGLDYKFANGLNGGISYRYMKNKPTNEDNSLTAKEYFVNDLTVYYWKQTFEIGAEIKTCLTYNGRRTLCSSEG